MSTAASRAGGAHTARTARQTLAEALSELQRLAPPAEELALAVDHAAKASSALYGAEMEATTDEAISAGIQIAVGQLTHALRLLGELRHARPELEPPLTSIARTLALLYPAARAARRPRRHVQYQTRPSRAPPPGGAERRSPDQERVFVEVDVGLASKSNFYAGLSLDVSSGGVFVSTYQPSPPGTQVCLYFVLPSGHSVHAEGVVRWTREASPDCEPGMGVAFTTLSEADARAIAEFCAARPPHYWEHNYEE
jgi:uncharacterized protein (TIGR02266 family)